MTTCRRRCGIAVRPRRTSAVDRRLQRDPFAPRRSDGRLSTAVCDHRRHVDRSALELSLPATMRDTSSRSLMSCACWRTLRSIVSQRARSAARRRAPRAQHRRASRRCALSGERSSCESTARNSSLPAAATLRVAARARSRAAAPRARARARPPSPCVADVAEDEHDAHDLAVGVANRRAAVVDRRSPGRRARSARCGWRARRSAPRAAPSSTGLSTVARVSSLTMRNTSSSGCPLASALGPAGEPLGHGVHERSRAPVPVGRDHRVADAAQRVVRSRSSLSRSWRVAASRSAAARLSASTPASSRASAPRAPTNSTLLKRRRCLRALRQTRGEEVALARLHLVEQRANAVHGELAEIGGDERVGRLEAVDAAGGDRALELVQLHRGQHREALQPLGLLRILAHQLCADARGLSRPPRCPAGRARGTPHCR